MNLIRGGRVSQFGVVEDEVQNRPERVSFIRCLDLLHQIGDNARVRQCGRQRTSFQVARKPEAANDYLRQSCDTEHTDRRLAYIYGGELQCSYFCKLSRLRSYSYLDGILCRYQTILSRGIFNWENRIAFIIRISEHKTISLKVHENNTAIRQWRAQSVIC